MCLRCVRPLPHTCVSNHRMTWDGRAALASQGGPVVAVLSLNFWTPIARLTFGVYLTHIMIIRLLYNSTERQFNYNDVSCQLCTAPPCKPSTVSVETYVDWLNSCVADSIWQWSLCACTCMIVLRCYRHDFKLHPFAAMFLCSLRAC